MNSGEKRLWWRRPDLDYRQGELCLAGVSLQQLAQLSDFPTFIYSGARVRDNLTRLHSALAATDLEYRIYYAMKANRFPPLLTYIKMQGLAGVDVCSPEEMEVACGAGFREEEISFTATSLSTRDLDILARYPRVHINCDSLSTIRRLGERSPGREIGLRINPAVGVSYGDNLLLQYSGQQTTKFGIYREHLEEAIALAQRYKLRITHIHFHVGIGYLTHQLELWEEAIKRGMEFIDQLPDVRSVNLGGGLGLPHREGDIALDLDKWAATIKRHLQPRGLAVAIEPGDYIVKDSGVLLLQVNSVEKKRDTLFVGVNGGFNLAVEPFFYDLPCEPVPCRIEGDSITAFADDRLIKISIAGNINEALDIWAHHYPLPAVNEGDYIAFLNAGGYAASMSSNHCLRGELYQRLLV